MDDDYTALIEFLIVITTGYLIALSYQIGFSLTL